ncbi:enoyl-CoA hydratase/isomerase family protein [Azospirillum sp.]|uniref:enoyl-CoA hydratase/isomerase family protein n=1 Tax=Azospirillum sp. TaxID=34012 RepID=UPI003D742C0C
MSGPDSRGPQGELRVGRDGAVVRLTLNRPQAMNTYTPELARALADAAAEIHDDRSVSVVVLAAAGRAFCTGADFRYMDAHRNDPAAIARFNRDLNHALTRIAQLPQPVIGQVHGHALGGGLETMLVCDLVVAAEDAVIGDPHVEVNFIHGAGGSQRLPRRVGLPLALDLVLTGRRLTAREAQAMGLVTRVVPAGDLTATVDALARTMAGRDPQTLRELKRLVHTAMRVDLSVGLALEEEAFVAHATRPGGFSGIDAFLRDRRRA